MPTFRSQNPDLRIKPYGGEVIQFESGHYETDDRVEVRRLRRRNDVEEVDSAPEPIKPDEPVEAQSEPVEVHPDEEF